MKRVQYLEHQEVKKLLKAASLERASLSAASLGDDFASSSSPLSGTVVTAPAFHGSRKPSRRLSTTSRAATAKTQESRSLQSFDESYGTPKGCDAEALSPDDDASAADQSTGRSIFVRYSGPQTFLVASLARADERPTD